MRFVRNIILLLLGSALLGTLLLVLVFCLPVGTMNRHVAESVDAMIKEADEIPESGFSNYIWTERETYTDAIMVQNAIERLEGKNPFEHAMWMYHNDLEEEFWTPEASLKAYCAGEDTDNMYLHEYSRYWHGYLVYLKPLLMIFTWKQLMIMGVVLQLLMMAVVICLAVKKKQSGVAVALVIGFLFMKPILVLISLTMSVCWIITLAALAYMLLWNDRLLEKEHYPEFFLITGIVTSYFDFLTYPVVTLGFPLCTYFLINRRNTVKEILQRIIGYSVCWGIGYAGMWAMKWVIADLTLHTGTIRDALWSIIGRTESIGGRPRLNGGIYVIGLNLQEYDRLIYPTMAAVLIITSLALIVAACRRVGTGKTLKGLVPFAITFCIPFVWIIAVQHHSALHARFTFRIIAVAALAIGCMGIQALWKLQGNK